MVRGYVIKNEFSEVLSAAMKYATIIKRLTNLDVIVIFLIYMQHSNLYLPLALDFDKLIS
jgi:hypothetical protein